MPESEPPTNEPEPAAIPDSGEVENPQESSEAETAVEPGEDNGAGPTIDLNEIQASIEALLYASAEPLSLRALRKVLPEARDRLEEAIERLSELYRSEGRGLQIVEVAGGFQITTRPEYHETVSRLFEAPRPPRLSIQALESLAVIAYRQPVTVPELMELRGVRSASVVRTLLERKLIRIVGRKNVVGRPLLYGTTKEFMLRFGLKSIRELPQLKDMADVFGDEVADQLEVLDGLGPVTPEDILPVDAPEDGAVASDSETVADSGDDTETAASGDAGDGSDASAEDEYDDDDDADDNDNDNDDSDDR